MTAVVADTLCAMPGALDDFFLDAQSVLEEDELWRLLFLFGDRLAPKLSDKDLKLIFTHAKDRLKHSEGTPEDFKPAIVILKLCAQGVD
jgi:hypothetical protein